MDIKNMESIVIGGISGRWPKSKSVAEFWDNLVNGVDMIGDVDPKWNAELHGIPTRNGRLEGLDKFDAEFFGVHEKQASSMDPRLRLLLELTHEAIVDAGFNPGTLRGSRTGVFVGASGEESRSFWRTTSDSPYLPLGTFLSMLANRTSFAFDLKGPSLPMDTACSSSFVALHEAILNIRNGICDAAVVSTCHTLADPDVSIRFNKLGMLSTDGKCKSFDAAADGYVRSEAAVVLFICKESFARRNYARVLHVKTNSDGNKEQGLTFPSGAVQEQLLRETYEEAGVDPMDVVYVEAHGTGTPVGDPQEVNAIDRVLCNGRSADNPLLIGSVKSNMGHSEAASGLCCIAKVVLAAQTGTIPGNLHFKTPNPNLVGITSGRMKVVDKNTAWTGGIVAVNSFGFGGSNVHVILETEVSQPEQLSTSLPQLVPYSARTMQGVEKVLNSAKDLKPDQIELLRLVQNTNIPSHRFRGYAIPQLSIAQSQELANPKVKPPVWLIFSGMGSQWKGMGRDLFGFQVFRDCFKKLANALKPHDIDLISYIMDDNPVVPSEGFSSAICICAIQIALIDLLNALEIEPDGYFGHSFGEMACAYVDGCYTAEETILLAWARSRAILDSNLSPGAMASLGLSWEETVLKCPPEITPACHNAIDNVSVAGTPESILKFLGELKSENIFAREIDSAGYAFHSHHMKPAEKNCREYFARLGMKPCRRSPKWVSTSAPKHLEETESAQFVCDDYFVNNVLSPVLFHDAMQKIPANAVVIEVAPHGILQAIIKRSLPKTCTTLSLCSRSSPDNVEFFLKSVGNMFISGLQPQTTCLYPASQLPLGASTLSLSPLIEWDHSSTWAVPDPAGDKEGSITEINLTNKAHAFYAGHKIDGRVLYPATGYLYLAWKALALKNTSTMDKPVVFENVELKRATIMTPEASAKFNVNIHDNGHFEIVEGGASIVTGSVKFEEPEVFDFEEPAPSKSNNVVLSSADAYKELRLRGYEYTGEFQAMNEVDSKGRWAKVAWRDNWIPFLDNMLQLECFSKNYRGLFLPTRIEKVSIDPKRFQDILTNNAGPETFEVLLVRNEALKLVHCEGVEIRGVHLTSTKKNVKDDPFMEGTVFAPFFDGPNEISEEDQVLAFYMGVVADNLSPVEKTAAIASGGLDEEVKSLAEKISGQMEVEGIYIQNITNGTSDHAEEPKKEKKEKDKFKIKSTHDLSEDTELDLLIINSLTLESLPQSKFIIYRGATVPRSLTSGFRVVASKNTPTLTYFLLKKNSEPVEYSKVLIGKNFDWVVELQGKLKEGKGVELISTAPSDGIIGFVRTLRKEPGGDKLRCYFEREPVGNTETWPEFNYNVYQDGRWGAFYSYELSQSSFRRASATDAYVNALTPGDLSSLTWLESPKSGESGVNKVLVSHAALNFRDVMLATGKLSSDAIPGMEGEECILGMEYSGVTSQNKRVMGMVTAKALATTVQADPAFMWEIPTSWSFADAATVPVVYATAYYALIVRGRMQRGESVLIHAGAGGVGQAAIAIALSMNCRVFTTVSSKDKEQYLKNRFPQLTDASFANSRSYRSFEKHVQKETQGRGVDLVLNSLAGKSLQASVRCLAEYGRFLEIGKFDLSNNTPLGMSIFLKSITFNGILLDAMMQGQVEEKREVANLLQQGIDSGVVQPLKSTVYSNAELEPAFRYLASGSHIGKVVVEVNNSNNFPQIPNLKPLARTYFNNQKSYVIIGGLGGFGLELANWMVDRGARKLVFVSRSGVTNKYQEYRIQTWKEKGCEVLVSQDDMTRLEGCRTVLDKANKVGPVGGLFNLAMVLRDGVFEHQTKENFHEACSPKIDVTLHLDKLTRTSTSALDYFVVFSSVASGKGNPGQTNYAYANSYMERVCESRRRDGLPGLAIQWGAIGDVGVVHDRMGGNDVIIGGTVPQRIASCLNVMDSFLQQDVPVVSSLVLPSDTGSRAGGALSVAQKVGHILGVRDISKVNPASTLTEMGMDSLMSSEIKQVLEREKIVLTAEEIGKLSFSFLTDLS